jgi:hypothetical protein
VNNLWRGHWIALRQHFEIDRFFAVKMLLDELKAELRIRHYSRHTEESYLGWAKRYVLFHKKRHPREMGSQELQAFLTYLAVQHRVSASTQIRRSARCCFFTGKY